MYNTKKPANLKRHRRVNADRKSEERRAELTRILAGMRHHILSPQDMRDRYGLGYGEGEHFGP